MKKKCLWAIIIFSIIGMAVSFLSTHAYFQILKNGFEQKSFCNISELINCDAVYASSAAKIAGIPVSWFGFIYYLLMAVMAASILVKKGDEKETASFAWILTVGGIAVSLHMAYTSFFILKVVCLLCLTMDILNLVLFFLWHHFLEIGFTKWKNISLKFKGIVQAALVSLLFFGVGWAGMNSYQGKIIKASRLNIPVEQIVQFHFKGSEYQFTPDPEAPVWGNPNAKVTIVEFSDFQCPFCKEAAFKLKPMLTEFKDQVRLYFYNYPLDHSCNDQIPEGMHDKSCMAAEASLCAAKMGDFWNYHDEIFRNQKNLSRELLLETAKKQGLNEAAFTECLDSPETLAKVKESIAAGNKIFVTGTPTLLVNNRRVKYWMDPEVFKAIIQEEIKRSN
ncbi:MAG: vitamin K epoxide reductase family protein [Deltaproteobacteria bacterium]|nr:vitamin K epoxide reductase family protein [Deltaproteobacteria bacterium]